MSDTLIRGARRILIGGPQWEETSGDILVRDGRLESVGGDLSGTAGDARILDAAGLTILPGLVQTHVHVCQTLFRGLAEDLTLLPWLRRRIWPLEAAHDPDSLRASARLSICEMLLSGTTTILDMGTTHHHDSVFEALFESGIRAASGKAMMDDGEGVPLGLLETTLDSLRNSFDLAERWDGAANGLLKYAFAPRFALSCTDILFREIVALAQGKYLLHTHASENEDEARIVAEVKGMRNVDYFDDIGFLSPDTLIAHCVWLEDSEVNALARSGARALHCPSTNLKLGSGIAELSRLRDAGVHVSIGCDGAPANNRLDAFGEMRTAALLAQTRSGPGSVPAVEILTRMTLHGAEALDWADRIGTLNVGKDADLIAVDLDSPHAAPVTDPVTALVYSAQGSDVRHTMVAGEVLVEDGVPTRMDPREIVRDAEREIRSLVDRARDHGYDPGPINAGEAA